jgi:hypothetical protein
VIGNPPTVAAHIYRACLLLYPSTFRFEFGEEMLADFDDATNETWLSRGWIGVLMLWACVALDLARSVLTQWIRTGLPALAIVSAAWSTMMCTLIAQQFVPRSPVDLLSRPTADEEVKLILIGMAVLICVIAAIIGVTGWFWTLVVRRKRRA